MKVWKVAVPVRATVFLQVAAATEEEAIDAALAEIKPGWDNGITIAETDDTRDCCAVEVSP